MDRRDLFKTIAGVAAGAGVVSTVQIAEASERTVPVLAVFECDAHVTPEIAERIRTGWQNAVVDTPFSSMKAVVLGDGLRLTLLDAQGRVLNRDITQGDDQT